jgi:hypothetical protein
LAITKVSQQFYGSAYGGARIDFPKGPQYPVPSEEKPQFQKVLRQRRASDERALHSIQNGGPRPGELGRNALVPQWFDRLDEFGDPSHKYGTKAGFVFRSS